MKIFMKILMILVLGYGLSTAAETSLGKISLIQGNGVEINPDGKSEYEPAKLDDPIFESTTIKTDKDSKAEITWKDDRSHTIIKSGKEIRIRDLYQQTSDKKMTSFEKLWVSVGKLISGEEKENSGNVASIRGDDGGPTESLHWKSSEAELESAQKLFDEKEYEKCIEILDQVIKEDPTDAKKAIILVTRGLAHYQLKHTDQAKENLELFIKEFSKHLLKDDAQSALNELKEK
ncbi:MAG: hypothetical protein B6244_06705 [Candidatus Cloacimonetes bacterium 4572_55]|nr:MAG: hypothetical protein B6244_06705 [Candidatus Cloacimonetes bacterium 4572_55]